jgi:peptidyl-prolyl cis-trans isomerase SurA
MRISRILPSAGLIVVFTLTTHAELADGIKAIVNDTVITYQQVEKNAGKAMELLQRQYGSQPELYRKKVTETLNDALEDLVQRQLILHEFKTAGYNLPETVLDQAVEERIRERFDDRASLTKTLQTEHMTYEGLRQQIREQIVIEAMRSKNISSQIIISPQKIEAYYNEHKDEFKVEEQIRLRTIVLDADTAETQEGRKKLGQEILGKLKEGAAFAELAAIYSTGPYRNQGGDRGWVERSLLLKELADVAFSLKPGQHSDVIETGGACYLMQVEDYRPSQVKTLSEVREEIEKNLLIQERARRQKEWIDKLKTKTFVRYF